jgi:rhodanese-related sulfurtransferase
VESVRSTDDVQRVGVNEARMLVEADEGLLVDTRSAESYYSQHAAGAISLPEAEAAGRIEELPTDRALIFY